MAPYFGDVLYGLVVDLAVTHTVRDAAAILAHPPWAQVVYHTVVPHFRFTPAYVSAALALLGTTLTSYAYVWETIEEAEKRPPLHHLGLVQVDAGLGMLVAGVIFYFIVVCTGATLGAQHKVVQTAQDAAAALAPVAGPLAATVFGIGLLASAMLPFTESAINFASSP